MDNFDFCPNSHVAEELPPEEPKVTSFNGWDFTARPVVPYRPKFKVTLDGLYWYVSEGLLDVTTDAQHNAGRLLNFYKEHRLWKTFTYNHEYYGEIVCRFDVPVILPKALPDSGGLLPSVEITLIQHSPGY